MMIFKLIYKTFIIFILIDNIQSSRYYDESSEIKTAQINLNDPDHQSLLQNSFNLSADEINRLRMHGEQKGFRVSAATNDENDRFKALKDDRKEAIKNKIFDVREKISPPEELTHEMAAYPSCNQNNESQWMNENNVTVKFSTTFFERNERNLYLDTAVLRLFKLNPNKINGRQTRSTESNDCDETPMDEQIRVTVSTIQTHRRNRKDKKKRICNTIMLNVSHQGWVEIDVKRAINIWEKFDKQTRNPNQNSNSNDSKPVMIGWLTIEVHDEEERPLKPGLYFEPPKCSQAYPALPWNAYRIYYRTEAEMEKVPKSPRLDVKLVDLRGVNAMFKRSNSALNFTPLNDLNLQTSSLSSSSIQSSSSTSSTSSRLDCNKNHTNLHNQHQNHHDDETEYNHHNNNVNPEQTFYYADKLLNATAKKRIDEILFSTVTALSPHVSQKQFDNTSSPITTSSSSSSSSSLSGESRRHMKRNISIQQIEQHYQQQFQPQHNHQNKHNHNHRNHNRNNGRRHLKQKQRHQRFINTNTKKNNNNNNNNNLFNYNSIRTNMNQTNTNNNNNNISSTHSSILIGKLRNLSK